MDVHLPSIANADPASPLPGLTLGRRRRRRRQGRRHPMPPLRADDFRSREHVQIEPPPVRTQVSYEALGRHVVADGDGGGGVAVCDGAGRVAETLGGHRPTRKAAVRPSCRDAEPLVLPSPGAAHTLRSGTACGGWGRRQDWQVRKRRGRGGVDCSALQSMPSGDGLGEKRWWGGRRAVHTRADGGLLPEKLLLGPSAIDQRR